MAPGDYVRLVDLMTVCLLFLFGPVLVLCSGEGSGLREGTPIRRRGIGVGLPGALEEHLHVLCTKGK